MAGKNTYRIGEDGSANYPNLVSIPTDILTQSNTTFLIYPGTYTAPANAVIVDASFVGVGDRDEIVINGTFTIANTSSDALLFENLTLQGPNAVAGSGSACVSKFGAASLPIKFERVLFSNADTAVIHSGELSFATTIRQVTMNYSDASGVDKAVRANANVGINFCSLNLSANAYFTPGGGTGIPAVTVRASTSAGSNTGNTTKTVLALVS
jgi:hypothetical protein